MSQIELRGSSPDTFQNFLREGRGAKLALGACGAGGDWLQQQNGIAGLVEVAGYSLAHIFQNANDTDDRSWINAFAARFVIQRNIAAGDGGAEGDAGL